MGKQQPLGCGQFSESEWADLVVGEERPPRSPLLVHLQSCPACRAEMAEYERLTSHVRHVAAHDAHIRDAFVDGVMADIQRRERAGKRSGRAEGGLGRLTDALRRRSPSLARTSAAPAWAAAALALFILIVATGLPWSTLSGLPLPGLSSNRSTGEALPGGTIFISGEAGNDARTAGLTTFAAVSATGGTLDAPGAAEQATASRDAGLAIRVSKGIVSAAAGIASPSEGGFSVQ